MRSLEDPLGPKVWEWVEEAGRLSPDNSNPWCAWGGRKGGSEGCWSINGVKGTETRPLPSRFGGKWGLVIRGNLDF